MEEVEINIELPFIKLSKGSIVYGANSSHSMLTYVCGRCFSVVVDKTSHARWHQTIEHVIVTKIIMRSNY